MADNFSWEKARHANGRGDWTLDKYEEAFQGQMRRQRDFLVLGDKLADLLAHSAFRSWMPPEVQDEARGLLAEWDALAMAKSGSPAVSAEAPDANAPTEPEQRTKESQ